jgi:hypothetical protein
MLIKTTSIEKKSLPRLVHHLHQPIAKEIAIYKSANEKLSKESENLIPILLTNGRVML